MESEESIEVDESSDIISKNNETLGENNENSVVLNISDDQMSSFMKAPELFALRENLFKNKSKDEDLYKGPKFYYPSDATASEEIIEDIMQDNQKSLKLQRIVKNKDCLKAEWNEEQKVAVVPYLKGRTTQHMGITVNGKCILSPEEAVFLQEKGIIEVEYNKTPLSIEEAYAVMLKGKLAVEKYEVYTHLSQQGFIVVRHHSRIGPNYLKVMNISKKKKRKRKAEDSSELPEQKRLTFSGVFPSNSVKVENDISRSCSLNNDISSNNDKLVSFDSLKKNKNMASDNERMDFDLSNNDVTSSNFDGINSNASLDREITSNNDGINSNDSLDREITSNNDVISSNFAGIGSHASSDKEAISNNDIIPSNLTEIDSHASLDKETNLPCLKEQTKQDDNVKELVVSTKVTESSIDSNNVHTKDKHETVEHIDEKIKEIGNTEIEINDVSFDENVKIQEFDVTNVNENIIDVESVNIDDDINKESVKNDNDGDTSEVIIEDEQKSDVNVEDSGSGYDDNEECESTDESIPIVYEDNSESLDVYSCSPTDHQGDKDLNIEASNLISKLSKDPDEDVTLVRVMKKEKKPLAVIDLLSDEEDNSILAKTQAEANGEKKFEDSDEEIEVLDEVPGTGNNKESSYRSANSIKLESGKLKTEACNIKTPFKLQMKYPEAFRKDIICVSRPPINLLPMHCQPAREAYILNSQKSQPRSGRVWNSYKDMQEYQRERHRDKQRNSFFSRSSGPFRDQSDSFSNQMSPFCPPDYSRDMGIDRNPNYPVPTSQNFYPPMNSERGGLLPTPTSFNSPNHMPFSMNVHNLQNLSTANPTAFVNEIQRTVYSVASNMISTILNQHLNPNNSPPTAFNNSNYIHYSPHNSNFSASAGMPGPMSYNSTGRNDFHPIRFPPEPAFSGERQPFSMNESPFMMQNNWRQNNFRQRNFIPRGPSFPCRYRAVRRKRDWSDVKAVVEGNKSSDSGSDIEEVPINLNRFLYSNDIKPLIDPGKKLPVVDCLKSLKVTNVVNFSDTKFNIDRYLPATPMLEISFDVYLPNTKYKRSEPGTPNYRIIVVRASDPIPRYSELVNLQRKWNDGAFLQVAVVDHGDISFYSFNGVNIQELIPFDSLHE